MQVLAVPVPLLVLLLHPVVLAILDLPRQLERLGEETPQVVIVGLVLEAEAAHVAEVLVELHGEARAEVLDVGRLLLLADLLVLLLVGRRLEALPRQAAAQKVHEDVAQSLEIVSPRLLPPEMGVDAHVPGGSRERLALPVGDVLLRLGVAVLLGHAEVDNVDDICRLGAGPADQEVVGLDVAVDQVLFVNRLDTRQLQLQSDIEGPAEIAGCTYHLLGHHADRLEAEPPVAVVKEVFQRRAEQVDDQDVVQAFLAKVIDIGNTS